MDLYGEELRVWKECWRDQDDKQEEIMGVNKGSKNIEVEKSEVMAEKMSGGFEW